MLKTLSIFTGNFFPTYFFPIKADKERPSIVRINPETVWSCFRITVTNACNDENIDADKMPTKTERNILLDLIKLKNEITVFLIKHDERNLDLFDRVLKIKDKYIQIKND